MYQVLAKTLANRLKKVIGSVISYTNFVFIKGKQTLDGILISNEVVDEDHKSKKELLLFKFDFEKTYNSVDWKYLDDVMEKMNCPVLWNNWILECVCIVDDKKSYRVLSPFLESI